MRLAFIARNARVALELLPPLVSRLQRLGLVDTGLIRNSEYPGHAVALASELAAQADVLVAVGGDGTLHEVVNGALQWAALSGAGIPPLIAVIACGTANDFVRSIPGAGSEAQFVDLLARGAPRRVDLGLVQYRDDRGVQARRYFVNVVDAGIGADVVSRLAHSKRRFGARFTYLSAIFRVFAEFGKPVIGVALDGSATESMPTLAFVAGNGRYFGSGLGIVPDARIDDGLLHCARIGDVSMLDFVSKLPSLLRGAPISHPQVRYDSATVISLESGEPVGLEADGEFLGYLPATIRTIPAAIEMLLPPGP